MNNENHTIPFLKWAGGKRWLVNQHSDLIPTTYNNYFEPFLGSGALFFYLKPHNAFLTDLNEELINTYKAIKSNWRAVLGALQRYQKKHNADFYYRIRNTSTSSAHIKAARFIYLNRTCWNGLYRVNKEGKFNVPVGTKANVLLNSDDFEKVSTIMKEAHLAASDFEPYILSAKKGDFIFVDPPYTVMHNSNNFIKYNQNIFSWKDQLRLARTLHKASKKGVLVMHTNANHKCIRELYSQEFAMRTASRPSVIAASSTNRGICTELIITNY